MEDFKQSKSDGGRETETETETDRQTDRDRQRQRQRETPVVACFLLLFFVFVFSSVFSPLPSDLLSLRSSRSTLRSEITIM